jgi:hypothetical protein
MPCSGTAPNLICTVAKTSLSNGAYSFKAYVNDTLGRMNSTSYLTYTVTVVAPPPIVGGGGGSGGGQVIGIVTIVNLSKSISSNIINITENWKNITLIENILNIIHAGNDSYTLQVLYSNSTNAVITINFTDGKILYSKINLDKNNISLINIGEKRNIEFSYLMKNLSRLITRARLSPNIQNNITSVIGEINHTVNRNETIFIHNESVSPPEILDYNKTPWSNILWFVLVASTASGIILFFKRRKNLRLIDIKIPKVERNPKKFHEIHRYILYCQKNKFPDDEILAVCVEKGWDESIIKKILSGDYGKIENAKIFVNKILNLSDIKVPKAQKNPKKFHEIHRYILYCQKNRFPDKEILAACVEKGWDEFIIKKILSGDYGKIENAKIFVNKILNLSEIKVPKARKNPKKFREIHKYLSYCLGKFPKKDIISVCVKKGWDKKIVESIIDGKEKREQAREKIVKIKENNEQIQDVQKESIEKEENKPLTELNDIDKYISKCLEDKFPEDKIIDACVKIGWNKKEIEKIIKKKTEKDMKIEKERIKKEKIEHEKIEKEKIKESEKEKITNDEKSEVPGLQEDPAKFDEIRKYISHCVSNKLSDNKIINICVKKGWNKETIKDILDDKMEEDIKNKLKQISTE